MWYTFYMTTTKVLQRFWGRVDKSAGPSGCWVWTGNKKHPPRRYGIFFFKSSDVPGRNYPAHRISWLLEHGEMPPQELDVCHTCDNPECVNPAHLFLGTRKDNMQDCKAKGRNSLPPLHKGEDQHLSKLTQADVDFIRSQQKRYGLFTSLAKQFDVDSSTIERVYYRRTWN